MDKIRDFFYNKNDVVVALLILLIAATVIYFRVNAIMDYPSVMAAEQEKATQTKVVDKK
jgi:hypothetical protein